MGQLGTPLFAPRALSIRLHALLRFNAVWSEADEAHVCLIAITELPVFALGHSSPPLAMVFSSGSGPTRVMVWMAWGVCSNAWRFGPLDR